MSKRQMYNNSTRNNAQIEQQNEEAPGPPRNHLGKIQIGRLPHVPEADLVVSKDKLDNYVESQLSKYGTHRYDHHLDDSKKAHFINLQEKHQKFDEMQRKILNDYNRASSFALDSPNNNETLRKNSSSKLPSFCLKSPARTPLRSTVNLVLQEIDSAPSSSAKTSDNLPILRTPNKDAFILQDLVKDEERQRNSLISFAQYGHRNSFSSPLRSVPTRGNFSSSRLLDDWNMTGSSNSMGTLTTPTATSCNVLNSSNPPLTRAFSPMAASSHRRTNSSPANKSMTLSRANVSNKSLFSTMDESLINEFITDDLDDNNDTDNGLDTDADIGLVNFIVDDHGMLKDILLQSKLPNRRPLSATSYLPETSANYESLKNRSRLYKRQPTQRSLLKDSAGYEDEDGDEQGDWPFMEDIPAGKLTPEMKKAMENRRRKTKRYTQHHINDIVDEREHMSLEIRHIGKHKYIPITDFTHKSAEETAAMKEQHKIERECLVDIFSELNGEKWIRKDNWLSDEPIYTWFGVVVNAAGFICELQLACNNLQGPFPDVGKLVELEVLSLDDNHLTGTLPGAIISKLTKLEIFSIQHNIFQGHIPMQMLADLKHLREIWFTNNHFSGELHKSMGKLTHVTHFSVHRNELSGRIPDTIGKLMNLRVLLLGDNHFSGPIPEPLKSLYKLTHLSLHNNELTGQVPEWLEDMTSLHDVHLYGNKLEGYIPMSAEELFRRKRERQLEFEQKRKQMQLQQQSPNSRLLATQTSATTTATTTLSMIPSVDTSDTAVLQESQFNG